MKASTVISPIDQSINYTFGPYCNTNYFDATGPSTTRSTDENLHT